MTTPQGVHGWTVHVLNIEGIVFEKWVEHVVECAPAPWKIMATQYAVEFPPPQGPTRGFESCLDIWADHKQGTSCISLAIEAKKNDPRFVDWVFFPAYSARLKPILTCIDARKEAAERPSVTMIAIESQDNVIVCDACRETRGTWDSKDTREFTKSSSKAIGDAAHQVAIAVQALIAEQIVTWKAEALQGNYPAWGWNTFIPVIVTTANLKVLSFDRERVDPGSGTIKEVDTQLNDVEWLIYLYPIPRHLQFSFQGRAHLVGGVVEVTAKMPIFVVNSVHLPQFLIRLSKDNALYVGPWPPASTPQTAPDTAV